MISEVRQIFHELGVRQYKKPGGLRRLLGEDRPAGVALRVRPEQPGDGRELGLVEGAVVPRRSRG